MVAEADRLALDEERVARGQRLRTGPRVGGEQVRALARGGDGVEPAAELARLGERRE